MLSWLRRKQASRDPGPKVAPAQLSMTDEDIVGAALRPGFGPNPAAWRLNITRDRVLR